MSNNDKHAWMKERWGKQRKVGDDKSGATGLGGSVRGSSGISGISGSSVISSGVHSGDHKGSSCKEEPSSKSEWMRNRMMLKKRGRDDSTLLPACSTSSNSSPSLLPLPLSRPSTPFSSPPPPSSPPPFKSNTAAPASTAPKREQRDPDMQRVQSVEEFVAPGATGPLLPPCTVTIVATGPVATGPVATGPVTVVPLRKRAPKVKPSMLWTESCRPVSVDDIVGNGTAIEQLKQWLSSPPPYKPVLLGGPVGCGKTSLAHALFREHDFYVRDVCSLPVVWDDEKPGGVAIMVEELIEYYSVHALAKPAIILDEVDHLEGHQRSKLVKVLKSRPAFHIPILCICESVSDKSVDALKNACKVVRMFRPFSINKDVRTLLLRLQHRMALQSVSRQQLSMIEQVSQGDLRRATLLLQLVARASKSQKTLQAGNLNADAFAGSPFESASSILYGVPRLLRSTRRLVTTREVDERAFLNKDGAVELSGKQIAFMEYESDERCDMMRDDIVVFMLHENYVNAVVKPPTSHDVNADNRDDLDILVRSTELFADYDTINSHFMHQTHEQARTCLAAGLPRPAEAALMGTTPKLQFTQLLGVMSSSRARRLELSALLPWTRQRQHGDELVNEDRAVADEYASLDRQFNVKSKDARSVKGSRGEGREEGGGRGGKAAQEKGESSGSRGGGARGKKAKAS